MDRRSFLKEAAAALALTIIPFPETKNEDLDTLIFSLTNSGIQKENEFIYALEFDKKVVYLSCKDNKVDVYEFNASNTTLIEKFLEKNNKNYPNAKELYDAIAQDKDFKKYMQLGKKKSIEDYNIQLLNHVILADQMMKKSDGVVEEIKKDEKKYLPPSNFITMPKPTNEIVKLPNETWEKVVNDGESTYKIIFTGKKGTDPKYTILRPDNTIKVYKIVNGKQELRYQSKIFETKQEDKETLYNALKALSKK